MAIAVVAVTCLLIACAAVPVEGHTCASSGFGGCECNILGACNMQGQTVSGLDNLRLTGYAPSGIDQFAYNNGGTSTNLAYLCENDAVAILYDCNARIPLYAATMMTGAQLSMAYKRPNVNFRPSWDQNLGQYFQQTDADYQESTKRNICYETRKHKDHYFVDNDWYRAVQPTKPPLLALTPCDAQYNKIVKSVHKGHLIAARYGMGYEKRVTATFTYTNVVPQFGTFNSGQWNSAEGTVIKWSAQNCANYGGQPTQNARIYIVVGAIPSTYGTIKQRFFGQSGFSDYQSKSELTDTYGPGTGGKDYRVNVPRYLWTAVCCTFQYPDGNGQMQNGVKSMAFYRENEPDKEHVTPGLFTNIFPNVASTVRIFHPHCNL